MKTPKEKADELIQKFYDLDQYNKTPIKYCIKCAIICCKEILGYMGADRGYDFWTNVLYELEHYEF